MKQLIAVGVLLFFFGCSDLGQQEAVVEVNFRPLRSVTLHGLEIVDSLGIAINDYGYSDTLGGSKIMLRGEEIFHSNWQHGVYSGPIVRTRVEYAYCGDRVAILIGTDDLYFDRLLILKPDIIFDGYRLLFNYRANFIVIRKAEHIDGHLRLTVNNSWIRTGGLPDEIRLFDLGA